MPSTAKPNPQQIPADDTFNRTWGSSTKWKSSDLKSQNNIRENPGPRIPQPHPFDLNKPLPPLPLFTSAIETDVKSQSPPSTSTNVSTLARSLRTLPTLHLSSLWKSKTRLPENDDRGRRKQRKWKRKRESKTTMTDHGVQTTKSLENMFQKRNDMDIVSTDTIHPGERIPTPQQAFEPILPKALRDSPIRVPRQPSETRIISDYFNLRGQITAATGRSKYSNNVPSGKQDVDYEQLSKILKLRNQGGSDATQSTTTTGTYESRYSNRTATPSSDLDPADRNEPSPRRPVLTSTSPQTVFPSSLASHRSMSESGSTRYVARRHQSSGNLGTRAKKSALGSTRRTVWSVDDARTPPPEVLFGSVEPRQQETFENSSQDTQQSPLSWQDIGAAHLQIYSAVATPGVEMDVPDHITGSPLCPLHPKHKSNGIRSCPQHGKPSTSSHDINFGDSDTLDDELTHIYPRKAPPRMKEFKPIAVLGQGSVGNGFQIAVANHGQDDPSCPASPKYNGEGRGVCPLHGRASTRKASTGE